MDGVKVALIGQQINYGGGNASMCERVESPGTYVIE